MAIYEVSIERKEYYQTQEIEADSIDEAIEKAQDNIDEGMVHAFDNETCGTSVKSSGKSVYSDEHVIYYDIYNVMDELEATLEDYSLEDYTQDELYEMATEIANRMKKEVDLQDVNEEITRIIHDLVESKSK